MNNVIQKLKTHWAAFQLWRDKNHDGSQLHEAFDGRFQVVRECPNKKFTSCKMYYHNAVNYRNTYGGVIIHIPTMKVIPNAT